MSRIRHNKRKRGVGDNSPPPLTLHLGLHYFFLPLPIRCICTTSFATEPVSTCGKIFAGRKSERERKKKLTMHDFSKTPGAPLVVVIIWIPGVAQPRFLHFPEKKKGDRDRETDGQVRVNSLPI